MQARNRVHDCEQEGCTKKTKARFCEEHLPRCTWGENLPCGKKCRKFEDPATAVCFNHSQYLRDKTREKVARYRARDREIKQQRKMVQLEISDAVKKLADEGIHAPDYPWEEFLQDVWMAVSSKSGDELLDYKERVLTELA